MSKISKSLISPFLFFKKHFFIGFFIILFISAFSFLSYNNNYILILKSHEKNIVGYINNQIQSFQKDNPGTDIKFKTININIDGINLKDIQISTKTFQETHIPNLNINLDWWSLLSFNIKFKFIIPKMQLNIKINPATLQPSKAQNNNENLSSQLILSKMQKTINKIKDNKVLLSLFSLPISSLNILKADFYFINRRNNASLVTINSSIITVSLKKTYIKLDFYSSFTKISNTFLKEKPFLLHSKITIRKNKNLLLWTKVNYKNSLALLKIRPNFTELKINTPLQTITQLFNPSQKKVSKQTLTGNLSLSLKSKKPNTKIVFKSQLKNFQSSGFKIGDLATHGFFHNNKLQFDQVSLNSPIWSAKTKAFFMDTNNKDYSFSFLANIEKFYLNRLLNGNSVELFAKGLGTCKGQFFPFFLTCSATDVHIKNLKVYLEKKTEIVSTSLLKGLGQVNVNTKSVNFKSSFSNLAGFKKNKINIDGNINYDTSLNSIVKYKAFFKDLSFIHFFKKKLLGNVNVAGFVNIKNFTVINENDFKSSSITLEKTFLGNLSFQTFYKNQQLFINKIFLKTRNEELQGNLDFLFKKNTLFSNIQAKNINLSKLKPFLNEKYKNSFSGKIQKLSSQTLWNLDFKLLSSDTHILISNLLLNKLYFPITNIYITKNITNNFSFVKLDSLKKDITIEGHIFNNLNLNLNLKAKKMTLETFSNFSNTLPITSFFDVTSKIQGNLFKLDLKMNFKFYKTYFHKILQKTSTASIQYSNEKLSVLANLFNKTIVSKFIWNTKKMYFYDWTMKINNWDYSSLISFYSKEKKSIKANLNAELNLFKNKQNKYTGVLNISSFSLDHFQLKFKNKNPILATLKNNILSIKNFALKGSSGYLNVKTKKNSHLNNLNIEVNSKINLSVFNDFTSDILVNSGDLLINDLLITDSFFNPVFNGNLQINQLSTNSQSSIIPSIKNSNINIHILNSKAKLQKFIIYLKQNGLVNASGWLSFKNPFAINITGTASKLNLQTEEGFQALGSAKFNLSGKKNSYVLKSTYNILSGSFYKKISSWNIKNLDIDKNLLPKKQIKNQPSSFTPILNIRLKTINPLTTKFIVGNITIDTKTFGNLELNGPIRAPLLNGKLYSNTGEIDMQGQVITIDNVKIEYENTLLSKSTISLLAHSEINGVQIKIKARGPLSDIKFILSSDPPLPENKLAFLLVFGNLPEENNSDWKEVSKSTSYSILSRLLKDYLKIKENLNLNLDLTTKTETNTESTSSQNIKIRGSKPVLNIQKDITKKLRIKATTEFDDKTQNTFLLEYQINPNLSIKSSISDEVDEGSTNNGKNIEFGLEYGIEFE